VQPPLDNPVQIKLEIVFRKINAGWSSLVARRAHNPKVAGSNPAPATNLKRTRVQPESFCICIGSEAIPDSLLAKIQQISSI
jgi:hypothetical protein